MANIAKLPDGIAISTNPPGQVVAYGPHLTVAYEATSGYAILAKPDGTILAKVGGTNRPLVQLSELDPITVPYVNRFISPSGLVIIKDWRTSLYRTKVRRGGKAKRRTASGSGHCSGRRAFDSHCTEGAGSRGPETRRWCGHHGHR